MHARSIMLSVLALLVAAGCGKPKPAPESDESAPAPVVADVAKGKEIFHQRCVTCHGSTGHGDGPASASLNPKPRQFADPNWQASVTDDYIEKIVRLGGAAVGKSPAMPSNPDLTDPNVVAGLRTIVRGFRPN